MSVEIHTLKSPNPTTCQVADEFNSVRAWLKKASTLCDLVFNATEDNVAPAPADDIFNVYGFAAGALDSACAELENLSTFSESINMYMLEIFQVRDLLLLLNAKIGTNDFERVSLTGLARMLARDLLKGLDNIESAEKKAA